MEVLDELVAELVREAVADDGRVVVLTGAGISAASGIPTFRGPEGYWTVGSAVHRPEELATHAFFRRDPDEVWAWYLYRLGVCRAAAPNPAHTALVRLEEVLDDRLTLITQNVDGLHLRAGSSPERTFHVHGAIERMRCAVGCTGELVPVPADLPALQPGDRLDDATRTRLVCARCGGRMRPHVLWFDEVYDEERYRFDSSLRAAAEAALLVTVGTSGATNLPNQVVRVAASADATLIDVNPEDNPFGDLAQRLPRGAQVRAAATVAVPALVEVITAAT
jgi:NAD-dependent deacetylase